MTEDPDPTAVLRAYATAIDGQDWSRLRRLLDDRFAGLLVRTGERHDADGYVAFNRDYPGRWRFALDDVIGSAGRAAGRARVSDGRETFHVALLATVVDGRLTALDEVWTEDATTTSTSATGTTATGTTTTTPGGPDE